MVLNVIANELDKATDTNKLDLEKEINDLVDLYYSLEKYACVSRQSAGIRRANAWTTAHDIHDKKEPANSKVTQGRVSFLATSGIYQIFQMVLRLYNTDGSEKIATQNQSTTLRPCSKIISFILNASLHHIKSFSIIGKEDPLKILIYGDINVLGSPLLKLIFLLTSGGKSATQQKKKETKGKKDVEEQREYLHLALLCFKELIIINLLGPDLTGLLEDLVSVSDLENAGSDAELQTASWIDDQSIRSKESFIVKALKPLFFKLLEVSFYGEAEVKHYSGNFFLYFLVDYFAFVHLYPGLIA